MKRPHVSTFALAALALGAGVLLAPSQSYAQVPAPIAFNDGGVHVVNGASPRIEILDGPGDAPTTVTVESGAVVGAGASDFSVNVYNNSIFNMTGGALNDELFLFNNASAHLTGGSIGDDLTTADNSTALVDMVTVSDDVEAAGSSTVTINGGNFDEDIESLDSATITIHGGMFQTGGDAANVQADGLSVINIHGGTFGSGTTSGMGGINALGDSTINVYGGNLAGQTAGLNADGNGVINIYAVGTPPASLTATGAAEINVFDAAIPTLNANGSGTFNVLDLAGMTRVNVGSGTQVNIFGTAFKINNVDAPFGTIPAGQFTFQLSDAGSNNVVIARTSVNNGSIITLVQIPEPASAGLAIAAMCGIVSFRRSRR